MYKEINGDLITELEKGGYNITMHCHDSMGIFIGTGMSDIIHHEYDIRKGNIHEYAQSICNVLKIGNIYETRIKKDNLIAGGFQTDEVTFKIYTMYTCYSPKEASSFRFYDCPFDYDAFRVTLRKVRYNCAAMDRIIVPTLGCGSQKADWNLVKDIIKTELRNLDVTVIFKS